MDGRRFDDLTRALGKRSRRSILRTLVGAVAGLAPIIAADQDAAARCTPLGNTCERDGECCAGTCRRGRCRCRFGTDPCRGSCVRLRTKRNCLRCGDACGPEEVCTRAGCKAACIAEQGASCQDVDACCPGLVCDQRNTWNPWTCQTCASFGAYCRTDGDCCAHHSGDAVSCVATPRGFEGRKTCCRAITPENPNPSCNYHEECCNGLCDKNLGSQCCRPGGMSCASDAECCSDSCNEDGRCDPQVDEPVEA